MSVIIAAGDFHVVERRGPGGRLLLRSRLADRVVFVALAGYAGPELPDVLTNATLSSDDGAFAPEVALRISSKEGSFDCCVRAVEHLAECPALYGPLHGKFALTRTDRMAARTLLAMLRLPCGARLLRLWHSSRG
jgi:hypothetical protein